MKYQAVVLTLALIRFFMIGLLELNCEINLISGAKQDSSFIWTSVFAFMFFGHIVDNIKRAKFLFVLIEISCAIWFMIMG